MPKLGVCELESQVAVVGQQQQPFVVIIETADGVDPFFHVWDKLKSSRPTTWIMVGAEVTFRLVDHPVDQLLGVQRFAINNHFVRGINLHTQFVDLDAIDGNPPA